MNRGKYRSCSIVTNRIAAPLYTGSAGSETNENGDAIEAEVTLAESWEGSQEEVLI